MHNCKQTREDFVDLALAEPPVASAQLLQELDDCAACREEFASLRETLHVSGQVLRSTLPGEDFWQGYHARLRAAVLANASQAPAAKRQPFSATVWLRLKTFATSSFRLPVPAAIVAVLLLGISFGFLLKAARANATTSNNPTVVETKTIEVPVLQEKVVTKVVYVDRKSGRSVRDGRSTAAASSALSNSVATAGSVPLRKTALSLVGFKPTDEVKLTIIKGSHRDEK